MARIRTIKPDFWSDGTMVGLSPWARLFYVGTWTFSLCDAGHLADDAVGLKLKILPADNVDPQALLSELLAAGRLVRRYSTTGRSYLFNPRLVEHQKTDGRWNSRCPHCASEKDGGYTEDPRPPTETHRDSPEPTQPPTDSAQESKGRESKGREQNATRSAAAAVAPVLTQTHPDSPEPLSVTQRAKRITDAYALAEPMCKWPAINGVVIKAIKLERWSDDEIRAALLRLAGEGRWVTVETLRVELNGLPPGRASPRPATSDQRVNEGLALAERFDAELPKEITAA